jgi:hypothetical protein
MSAVDRDDPTFDRAAAVIGQSWIARWIEACVRMTTTSVEGSRSLEIARARLRAFDALPPSDRWTYAAVVMAVALAGHVVMASMLPLRSRPTVALTAVALLGASLAAFGATARNR